MTTRSKTQEEISAEAIFDALKVFGISNALERLCRHEGVASVTSLSEKTGLAITSFTNIEADWQFLQLIFEFFPDVERAHLRALDKDYGDYRASENSIYV